MGIDDKARHPRSCVQTLQTALHAEFRFDASLFREPDAGNPPVRFDEREEETEQAVNPQNLLEIVVIAIVLTVVIVYARKRI